MSRRKRWVGPWDKAYQEYLIEQKVEREMQERANKRAPYELYIYAEFTKEIVEPLEGHHDPWHSYYKRVNEQIYYNWYNSKEEALAKFDEKTEQYVKPILESKYYHCWPAHSVTIKLIKGSNIIREEHYEVD